MHLVVGIIAIHLDVLGGLLKNYIARDEVSYLILQFTDIRVSAISLFLM